MEDFKIQQKVIKEPEYEAVDGDYLDSIYIIKEVPDTPPRIVTETADVSYVDLVADDPLMHEVRVTDEPVQAGLEAAPNDMSAPQGESEQAFDFSASLQESTNSEDTPAVMNGSEGEFIVNEPLNTGEFSNQQVEERESTEGFPEIIDAEMSTIESEFHLPPEMIQEVRTELGVTRVIATLKEKWENLLNYTGLQTRKYSKTEISEKYQTTIEDIKNREGEIRPEVIKEAREEATRVFEGRGLFTLTKEEFNTYFISAEDFDAGPELKQSNIGDCYLVAAIHALSRSPNFETICRASMLRQSDGSWEIKIPLLGEQSDVVKITQEEIGAQNNNRFFKKVPGKISLDLRRQLRSLSGNEGFQALEAAYMKHKFGSVDRLASEGGHGDEALTRLGGDNFVRYSIDSATYAQNEKIIYPGLQSIDEENLAYLDHYLENFDPETHIATVSTKHDAGGLSNKYRVEGTSTYLVPGHAYSISAVDSQNKLVTVINPWDTTKLIVLTLDQFKENFSRLSAVRINNAKLLGRMTNKSNMV